MQVNMLIYLEILQININVKFLIECDFELNKMLIFGRKDFSKVILDEVWTEKCWQEWIYWIFDNSYYSRLLEIFQENYMIIKDYFKLFEKKIDKMGSFDGLIRVIGMNLCCFVRMKFNKSVMNREVYRSWYRKYLRDFRWFIRIFVSICDLYLYSEMYQLWSYSLEKSIQIM